MHKLDNEGDHPLLLPICVIKINLFVNLLHIYKQSRSNTIGVYSHHKSSPHISYNKGITNPSIEDSIMQVQTLKVR
jgi:hypothetical protein